MSLQFTVPGKPRGKGRPIVTRNGAFTDGQTAAYENLIKLTALEAGAVLLEGPLAVDLLIWLPIGASWSKRRQGDALQAYGPSKPDIDNVCKAVMDGLNGVAFKDDVQVCRLLCEKRYGHQARLEVSVYVLEEGLFS